MKHRVSAILAGVLLVVLASMSPAREAVAQGIAPAPGQAPADRYANYYYPPPQTRETYKSQAATLPDSTRERRLGFVTGMTQQMLSNPYPPPFAMFAKGDHADKLIIVSLTDDGYNTLYRARALFAMLTAVARLTPFFRENAVDDIFNFFDLCKLLGFKQITWSDGKKITHQVALK
jgi:hypothetical protein